MRLGLEDVSQVKKYEMSDADYEKREGTVRAWKKEMIKTDPNFKLNPENRKKVSDEPPPGPDSVAGMEVSNRCEVQPGARRGVVMYIGEVEKLGAGYWVGVKFDEPVGKGDGSAGGQSFYECPKG